MALVLPDSMCYNEAIFDRGGYTMARVRTTIYHNSILASLVSLFGTGFAMCGLVILISGEIVGGILCAAAGFAMSAYAITISERKQFNTWKKQVEAKGVDQAIRADTEIALHAYNSYPGQRTLNYIRGLNPAAADLIAQRLQAEKAQGK